jgi:hypothetical protein
MFLSAEKFPTKVAVERHLEAFVLKLNTDNPTLAIHEPTFNAILDRFVEKERLLEIKQRRPGIVATWRENSAIRRPSRI